MLAVILTSGTVSLSGIARPPEFKRKFYHRWGLKKSSQALSFGLEERLRKVIVAIKDCGKICDTYRQEHILCMLNMFLPKSSVDNIGFVGRVVKVFGWQSKFVRQATVFEDLRKGLVLDLGTYTARQLQDATKHIYDIETMVSYIFQHTCSRDEKTGYTAFIKLGGLQDNEREDPTALTKALEQGARAAAQDDRIFRDQILNKLGGVDKESKNLSTDTFVAGLQKTIEDLLAGNERFIRKLDAISSRLDNIDRAVEQQGERVIKAVLGDVHNRIQNDVSLEDQRL
jgi:hypothetical protein